jgi:F-type H+-transporting ATPase subunit delta
VTRHPAAFRYARALFFLGEESGKTESFLRQVQGAAELAGASEELRVFLADPSFSRARKREVVEAVFSPERGFSREVSRFLGLLVERGRFGHLPAIASALEQLVLEKEGVVVADLVEARPLPNEVREELRRKLEEYTGKKVRLRVSQDPSLIGGVVLWWGDRRYDASVRGRLKRMRDLIEGREVRA